MRKLSFFSAVLSLFLQVPASITWAQITKTINGTVSYESGMSKTTLSTPNGNVVVNLPQSLSGATITGTVSTQPVGKTEKERSRNLKELLKMVVNLGGQKIPLSETPANFDWITTSAGPGRTPLELLTLSGNKIAEVSLPPVLAAPAILNPTILNPVIINPAILNPAIINPVNTPHLTTPSNILVKGDALSIYTDHQFTQGKNFVIIDGNGQNFTVKPICQSANQAILTIPDGAAPGHCKVRMEEDEAPYDVVKTAATNVAEFNLIDINLTSPNTNLRTGQESFVLCEIKDFSFDPLGEIFHPSLYAIDLRNLNPSTVTMEGGNLQRVRVQPDPNTGIAQIKRVITGNTVGTFSVSATLHEDYNTSNDPFRPQLNALNTPEDFNAWTNALKNDLNKYANVPNNTSDEMSPRGNLGSVPELTIKRAVDNMPVCTSPEQLDESKAVAYSLLKPLNVPKGAANTWLSGYEAFRSALKSINESPANRATLPDWDVIANGLDFMERVAWRKKDQSMARNIENTRRGIDIFDENSDGNKTDQLFTTLHSLTKQTDSVIMGDELGQLWGWKMADVLFSTYCFNKKTNDGIDPMKSMVGYLDPDKKILYAKPEYQQQILSSFHAVDIGNGSYRINAISATRRQLSIGVQLMPLVMANVFDSDWWAEHLIEQYIKKDTSRGKIITTTKDSTGTYYIFYKDAKCTKEEGRDGKPSGCYKDTEWDPKEKKSKETGMYKTITLYPKGTCKKGTDFCTEVYVVTSITQYYMDANCTRLIKTEDFKHFSCL